MWAAMVPGRPSLKRSTNAAAGTPHGSRRNGWQCPSTTRRLLRSTPSVLVEVLRDLERRVPILEPAHLRPLDGHVLPGEHLAERGGQDLVALQPVERLAERRRVPADAAPRALGVGQRVGIYQQGLARIELALDPVEAGGQQATQREVGVAGGSARSELAVGRAPPRDG